MIIARPIAVVLGIILSCNMLCIADSLVNKKTGHVVSLGTANIENRTIHWLPCFAPSEAKNYSTLKFKVIPGTNCEASAELPKTASPLPLMGFLGLVLVALSFAMRTLRRVTTT